MNYYQLFIWDDEEKRHIKMGYVETKEEALAWVYMGEKRSFKEREMPSVLPKIHRTLEELINAKRFQ